ncbi:hypothetical protein AB0O68_15525 [Streptomyces sp. NPDC087512]|uniref:hypothetical protein n=1 Tax=Streptomyces sp. NPDC087512 TaxID=3155059 RepID=UPI00341C948F
MTDKTTDLRDRIADALAEADGWVFAPGFKEGSPTYQGFLKQADAVLAVLPAGEADRVRSLIADLESAVESRTAVGMADAVSLWPQFRDRIAQALVRMDAMVWLGTRRGERDRDESIGLTVLAGRLSDAALGTSQQPSCTTCGHLACDGTQPCRVLTYGGDRCRCLGPSLLRRRADETPAAEMPTAPVQHAPGKAIRCPDCRAKGYTICLDEPAAEACPPGCVACATDESHDPAPAAGARQDGARP